MNITLNFSFSLASSMENQMVNTISEDEIQILGSLGTGFDENVFQNIPKISDIYNI